MSAATTHPLTVDDYLAWCERPENAGKRTELVDGEIIEMPPAGRPHGFICYFVTLLLGDYLRLDNRGFATTNDAGLVLDPRSLRGPDIAVFMGDIRTDDRLGYGTRMPAVCVEVVSPSDRMTELHKRVRQYHAAGVPHVWVVQPDERAVFVHRQGQPVELLEGDAEITAEPELPGFSCKVSAFFTPPGSSKR